MSLKQEIEIWVEALSYYDNNEFQEAREIFETKIDDSLKTSKIWFNIGVMYATEGEHDRALSCYEQATNLDQYLAVAYFQWGVSNFLLGLFDRALANFNDALLYLRGNTMIDYVQLGLAFKLYSCEVLFNRGLCYIYLQQRDAGMQDLNYAVKEKVVEDHNVIDEAIEDQAEGYTVFSIPVGVVYRPNDAKVRNLKAKDYLGKARLVAATDRSNAFTGFTGAEVKNAGRAPEKDDRPAENISFAATNLVKRGLSSRRQQSEPPVSRLPPTPPPENDKTLGRTQSVRTGSGGFPRPSISIPPNNSRYNRSDDYSSPQNKRESGRSDFGRGNGSGGGTYGTRTPSRNDSRRPPNGRTYGRSDSRTTSSVREEDPYDGLIDSYEAEGRTRHATPTTSASAYNVDDMQFDMIQPTRPPPQGADNGRRQLGRSSSRASVTKMNINVFDKQGYLDSFKMVNDSKIQELWEELQEMVEDKFDLDGTPALSWTKSPDSGKWFDMTDDGDLELAIFYAKKHVKTRSDQMLNLDILLEN